MKPKPITYIQSHINTQKHTYNHTNTKTHTFIRTKTPSHIYKCIYTQIHIRAYVLTHTHIYANISSRTNTHSYGYKHIFMHNELIRDALLWTPTHGRAKAGRPARTYIQQLCEDTGCYPVDLPRAMNDREE